MPETFDNKEDSKSNIHESTDEGKKRQELLSKVGTWGLWERVKKGERKKRGDWRKMYNSIKNI